MGRIGFTIRRAARRRPPGLAPLPFSLALLPPGAVRFDFDPADGVTANGATVAAWRGHGPDGPTLTQPDPAAQPGFAEHGWAPERPSIAFDGIDDLLVGPALPLERGWTFLVAERGQNPVASSPSSRELYEFPRPSDGRKQTVQCLNRTQDGTQRVVRIGSAGTGATTNLLPGWGIGDRAIIVGMIDGDGNAGAIDGAAMGLPATTAGTVLIGETAFGGSQAATVRRQGARWARFLGVDFDLLPGGREQQYNRHVIEGYLAHRFGTTGTLRTDHPFRLRAPLARDWPANSLCIQLWGNSIGDAVAGQLNAALGYPARGIGVFNGCVGGNTTTQIRDRFLAGFDTGTGASSGAALARQRARIISIGEFFQNGPATAGGDSVAQMQTELAEMVTAVEAAQNVAAGHGRIAIWQRWVSWSDQSRIGGASRTAIDAMNDWLVATYPAYLVPMTDYVLSLAAPGSPHADPVYHARGQPPIALNRNGDLIHPDATLAALMARFLAGWLRERAWAIG